MNAPVGIACLAKRPSSRTLAENGMKGKRTGYLTPAAVAGLSNADLYIAAVLDELHDNLERDQVIVGMEEEEEHTLFGQAGEHPHFELHSTIRIPSFFRVPCVGPGSE